MGTKITKYGIKRFQQMDDGMRNDLIPKYYKEKYGKPFHFVVLLQVRGNLPMIAKKRPVEIDEEIKSIPGIIIMDKYFSCYITPKLKRIFGNNILPKPSKKVRPQKVDNIRFNAHGNRKKIDIEEEVSGIFYNGESCIGCGKPFVVDISEHPANLCGCLKCYPNGLGFSK